VTWIDCGMLIWLYIMYIILKLICSFYEGFVLFQFVFKVALVESISGVIVWLGIFCENLSYSLIVSWRKKNVLQALCTNLVIATHPIH
jgi:hypothetical protein